MVCRQAILVYLGTLWIARHYLSPEANFVPFWLFGGYLLHLSEDSFSKNSIHWFWPFSKVKRSSRKRLFYYRTGHVSEYLITPRRGCSRRIRFYR